MLSPELLAALPILLQGAALRAEPLSFHCDAPLGRSSAIWQDQPAAGFRLTGRIEIEELVQPPAGTATVNDRRGADVTLMNFSTGNYVTLAVGADPDGSRLEVILGYSIDDDMTPVPVGNHKPPGFAEVLSVKFDLLIAPERTVILVGSQSFDLPIALGAEVEWRASCAGASVHFAGLEVTHSSAGESGRR